MILKDMKTGKRLGLGFGVISLLLVVISMICLWRLAQIGSALDRVINERFPKTVQANDIIDYVNSNARVTREMLLVNSKEEVEKRLKSIEENRKGITENFDKLQKTSTSEESKKILKDAVDARAAYRVPQDEIVKLVLEEKKEEATKVLLEKLVPIQQAYREKVNKVIDYQVKQVNKEGKDANFLIGSTRILVIVLALIAIAIAVVVSLGFTRRIMTQLGGEPDYIADIAKRISEGDLTTEFKESVNYTGILGAMRVMSVKLHQVVAEIKSASVDLASGSEELSLNSERISGGMNEQAQRASQIASAATEMSQTVMDVAQNTSDIADSAEQTVFVAKEGETIVGQSVTEVREIAETVGESATVIRSLGERSKQIGEIVSVINDIADQTNLLALNAAIEAARAGEQGRGFAVVADEVRKLAERTANATSEIGSMIAAIQSEVQGAVHSMDKVTKKVDTGVLLSTRAGETLAKVVGSISLLQSMVLQIASATEELSSVSGNISNDIEGVALTSKDTSSGAEAIAQSSSELARLASTLEGIVGQFNV